MDELSDHDSSNNTIPMTYNILTPTETFYKLEIFQILFSERRKRGFEANFALFGNFANLRKSE